MLGDGIHGHDESQDMAGHNEDKEDNLCRAEDFTTPWPQKHLTSVAHVMNMRVSLSELSNDDTSVGCEEPQADEDDDGTSLRRESAISLPDQICWRGCAYGTRPKPATAPGRERTPNDTVSATMTRNCQFRCFPPSCIYSQGSGYTHANHIAFNSRLSLACAGPKTSNTSACLPPL